MDTFYYLEGSGLSGINSRDVVVLGKDFIWVGTWQTLLFKEYFGVLLIMDSTIHNQNEYLDTLKLVAFHEAEIDRNIELQI